MELHEVNSREALRDEVHYYPLPIGTDVTDIVDEVELIRNEFMPWATLGEVWEQESEHVCKHGCTSMGGA